MSDILRFLTLRALPTCNVTKQNGHRSVGTLHMDGVSPMIAFINSNKVI